MQARKCQDRLDRTVRLAFDLCLLMFLLFSSSPTYRQVLELNRIFLLATATAPAPYAGGIDCVTSVHVCTSSLSRVSASEIADAGVRQLT